MAAPRMKFCSHCASPVARRVPEGDDRERDVCGACGAIFYENPRAVVGTIIEHRGKVLLCRRAIEPARGKWTPPSGFLELGESSSAGALRETREEACANAAIDALFCHIDLPHIGQSYLFYRAHLVGEACAAGPESLEVAWFDPEELPFGELAFPVIHTAMELWLADRRERRSRVHLGALLWDGRGPRFEPASYRLDEHVALALERGPA